MYGVYLTQCVLQPSYSKIEGDHQERDALYLLRFQKDLSWRYANKTAALYLAAVKSLQSSADDLLHPSTQTFRKFLAGRRGVVSTNTINLELTAFRALYKWLYRNQYVPIDFSLQVPRSHRAERKKLVRHFTEFQMGQILAQPNMGTWLGFRDYVIIRLIYECGLRSRSIVRLIQI